MTIDRAPATERAPARVRLERVIKRYGKLAAVDDISLDLEPGSFVTLLGASGSGKTTSLRILAGFVTPDSGRVLVDGVDVTYTPPRRRSIGMVFQNYALFPHMTVHDNVAFGLRARRVDHQTVERRVSEMLALVHLEDYGRRYPSQLSGGQQQRVALARALAIQPRVLLLDEPLSALDARLRETMQGEIRRIQQELHITTLYVTHDQQEAFSMSDSIVVMQHGKIEGIGEPSKIYDEPDNAYVASFLGDINLLPGQLLRTDEHGAVVELRNGKSVDVLRNGRPLPPSGPVLLGIRPEYLTPSPAGSDRVHVSGVVERVKFEGRSQSVFVRAAPDLLIKMVDGQRAVQGGETVHLTCPPDKCLIFPSQEARS